MSFRRVIYILLLALLLASCSVTKFVPEQEYLLNSVKIVSHSRDNTAQRAQSYIRQQPNSKWFSLAKVPLYTYALSGTDTTKWVNRFLQKIGEPPVIYSPELAEQTRSNIEQMLRNEGYFHATVDLGHEIGRKRRLNAIYYLHERERYTLSSVSLETQDTAVANIIVADSAASLLRLGMPFSIDKLEAERRRITSMLRDRGYYRFQKDYITYVADTAHHSTKVNVRMNIALLRQTADVTPANHKLYSFNSVSFVSDAGLRLTDNLLDECDSVNFHNFTIRHRDEAFIRPNTLVNNTYIEPGDLYSQSRVDRTYNSFAQLPALRHTAIRMVEHPDTALLDCYIMFERNKRRSVTFDLEGTNTAGDFGAASSVTFSDKNLFKGSELLSLRLFGAYEAISGLSGYTGDRYFEYGAELSLRLFGGIFSKLTPQHKRLLKSSTQFSIKYNSQERPEFERRLLSGSWSYLWSKSPQSSHKVDVIDLNYIYVPWISDTFKKEYLDSISNRNSILKYNYENLLITKLGYSYSYTSAKLGMGKAQRTIFSLRTNVECSGNLLNVANSIFGGHKNADGQYTFMNIAYAQYVKGDFDFTTYVNIDERNSLVLHLGLGVAYPYGNSTILPFEKRYFSGGANSMRGWSVRGLGPGSFRSNDSNIDFINQSGDIKLDCNIEYRSHLFWKLHSAVFIDAGNIWTLRAYKEQPGGQFDVRSFYKEIAFSYGLGLRFELDLFVFRLDGAMKAINPAYRGRDKYPIVNPDFSRDFALHFAIGYPF